jgi:pyruvate/2-oxoglutarate dehydrogenase complex dihydrolipoamide acyltransferase (E2) component
VAYEFKLPDLGEGLTEGEIARWLVAEGQEIAEDDPLVEVQTDKTTVEIPSPAGGKVARILVGEGDVVPVGTVLVVIGEGGEASAPVSGGESRAEPPASVPATAQGQSPGPWPNETCPGDAARSTHGRGARNRPLSIAATGPQGRVTDEDVRRAAMAEGLSLGQDQEGRREPLRGGPAPRRRTHEPRTPRGAPVTWVEECDFSNVELKRLVPTCSRRSRRACRSFPS